MSRLLTTMAAFGAALLLVSCERPTRERADASDVPLGAEGIDTTTRPNLRPDSGTTATGTTASNATSTGAPTTPGSAGTSDTTPRPSGGGAGVSDTAPVRPGGAGVSDTASLPGGRRGAGASDTAAIRPGGTRAKANVAPKLIPGVRDTVRFVRRRPR